MDFHFHMNIQYNNAKEDICKYDLSLWQYFIWNIKNDDFIRKINDSVNIIYLSNSPPTHSIWKL